MESNELPLKERIAIWRAKQAAGQLTIEEMREIVEALRQGRLTASASSAKSRASKAPIDADALLDSL